MMDLPDPDSMFARGSALVALETRFAEDPRLRCYAHEREGEVEILRFDNGGGDHVWLLRSPDGVLLKAFDHESPVSRYARDAHGYTPDPSLTSGIPPALASFLRREILGHEGDDRTFVAWWADGRWTTRGPDAHPTDRLLLDAAGANEWLADAFDHTADPRALTQVLEGARAVDGLTLTPVPVVAIAGPPGWRTGQPFHLEVRSAEPVQSTAALKAIRAATGGGIGAIRAALADGTPLFSQVVDPHAFDAIRAAHAVVTALETEHGAALRVWVDDGAPQVSDRARVAAMLGVGGMFFRP